MIKLENVTKVYKGDHVALRDATLDIGKGEFVFLVGASGSGKSTFIRLLNREEVPEHGTIYVAGKDIGTLGSWKVPYLRRNIGYIFQDFKASGGVVSSVSTKAPALGSWGFQGYTSGGVRF